MYQLKEEADFIKLQNIDLCKALKGTVFSTYLSKLWDIKLIIKTIKSEFDQLQCDHCDKQAKIASEWNQENAYKLYCEFHFKEFGSRVQHSINLEHSKEFNWIVLNELERHLIHVQERIDYFHIENEKKDPILYEKVKGLIEEEFEQLKYSLESMATKCSKISNIKTKTKGKLNIEIMIEKVWQLKFWIINLLLKYSFRYFRFKNFLNKNIQKYNKNDRKELNNFKYYFKEIYFLLFEFSMIYIFFIYSTFSN